MLDKILNSVRPYALVAVPLTGAILAGRIAVVNAKPIGYFTIFVGILLVLDEIKTRYES